MTDVLQVRVYNVRFGDAILVSVPDRKADGTTTIHHILIDFGNALSTEGGADTVFEPVARDILRVLDGRPVDLYVMTHEHMDHVQGLKYVAERLNIQIPIARAWLTKSAEPGYYDDHPDSKQRRLDARQAYLMIRRFLAAAPEQTNPYLQALLENNDVLLRDDVPLADPALAAAGGASSTDECVNFIRNAGQQPACYVYHGLDTAGLHPFEEARLSVLAPEEDTSIYYGRFQPMALGESGPTGHEENPLTPLFPPPGVDAGTFFDLVESRRRGFQDNLLAIDAANNNTSVVVLLEWRGWRLLFPGDAEVRSWREMNKQGLLAPVHFLKVGHHGSANGSPPPPLLSAILPEVSPDGRPRRAAVSTFEHTYFGVPDPDTRKIIEGLVDEYQSTENLSDGEPGIFEFS